MGGCCCCSFKGGGQNTSPPHYHYPGALEEREPLSSQYTTASASSAALLVDTNLETSIPDSYRPPPAPLPFDENLRPPSNLESGNNNETEVLSTNSQSVEETTVNVALEAAPPVEGLKGSECKVQKDTELISSEDLEIELVKSGELKKSSKSFVADQEVEEDICPTCLEEYDSENPKINTKCEHHFHLACILEWMERSDTCPVCDQEMVYTV